MFIASEPGQSDNILEQIRTDQEKFFQSLNLHFQVLDMPPHDLGAPAYRKYDIEAWMPGRNIYGAVLFIFCLCLFLRLVILQAKSPVVPTVPISSRAD